MLRPLIAAGSLDECVGLDRTPEPLLQDPARLDDLPSRLALGQAGEGNVVNTVRLHSHPEALDRLEACPVEERVLNPELFVVRHRPSGGDEACRDEHDGWIAGPRENRCCVREVVEVAVVERDQQRVWRKRHPATERGDDVFQAHDPEAHPVERLDVVGEQRRRHGARIVVQPIDLVVEEDA